MTGQWSDLYRPAAEPPRINLCQYGNGCFGCCGDDYGSREAVWAGVEKNTREFHHYIRCGHLIAFRDRYGPAQRMDCGLCPNLIMQQNEKLGCPLHPLLNQGMDLRKGFCNPAHFCTTYKNYLAWGEEKRQRFLGFIDSKKLDWYDYSLGMTSGSLVKEFERLENTPLKRIVGKWFGTE
jgi:hypothetical protein